MFAMFARVCNLDILNVRQYFCWIVRRIEPSRLEEIDAELNATVQRRISDMAAHDTDLEIRRSARLYLGLDDARDEQSEDDDDGGGEEEEGAMAEAAAAAALQDEKREQFASQQKRDESEDYDEDAIEAQIDC